MLNDAMKSLTTRKPIALTTTSLCSGAFTARIAREQRLHVLRIAGIATADWEKLDRDVDAGFFKAYGLDAHAMTVRDATEATAALANGLADVAVIDAITVLDAHARSIPLKLVAMSEGMLMGYVALAQTIEAKHYAMARFARALRENGYATYVDARELQALADRFTAEKLIGAPVSVHDQISRFAVMSGTR